MQEVFDPKAQRVPIKEWLSELDELTLEQALNLAALPFAYNHVALMPDSHPGYGMPIGGVLAALGYVVPHAVGVDIGCGNYPLDGGTAICYHRDIRTRVSRHVEG
jgi:tRNA-splicing ligase RtcB